MTKKDFVKHCDFIQKAEKIARKKFGNKYGHPCFEGIRVDEQIEMIEAIFTISCGCGCTTETEIVYLDEDDFDTD